MIFAHIHSTKEKLYGLFNLHVQLDFTIGVKEKIRKKINIKKKYIEKNNTTKSNYSFFPKYSLFFTICIVNSFSSLILVLILYSIISVIPRKKSIHP